MPYTKQQLQIDLSGRKGLGDKFYGDINSFGYVGDLSLGQPQYRVNVKDANQDKDGQMASGIFNPLRKYGYLSPSVATLVDLTPAAGDVALMSAYRYDSINNTIYGMVGEPNGGNNPALYKLTDIDSETYSRVGYMPGGSTLGSSLEIYQINGVRTLFYSWLGSSGWSVGTLTLDGGGAGTQVTIWLGSGAGGSAVTNNFTMDSTGECKFVLGGDGFMYIIQANHVHRLDGTTLGGANGTIYKDVQLAPQYFRFTHGTYFNGDLYLAVQKSTLQDTHYITGNEGTGFVSDCGVYMWNGQSSFNGTSYIPIPGIREIRALWISPKNDIRCITVSANGVTQIRLLDGNQFKVIKELGAFAYPNYSDSLCVVGDFTVWLGGDGNLYYLGSEGVDINITNFGAIQSEKEMLFMMGSVNGGSGIGSIIGGAIFYGGGNNYSTDGYLINSKEKPHPEAFHLSYSLSGTPAISKFFPFANGNIKHASSGTNVSTSPNTTPIYTPIKMLPGLSTLKHITIMMARELNLTPGVTDATISIYINGNTTALMTKTITTTDIMKGYFVIEVNTPFVDCLQFSITYASTAVTNFRFSPSYAVVDFVPTDTIK